MRLIFKPSRKGLILINELLVLFGTPASGKDTISKELEILGTYEMLRKAKFGSGRSVGYRMLGQEPDPRQVISSVSRYGNKYYVLESELQEVIERNRIPIVCTTSVTEVTDVRVWADKHGFNLVLVGLVTSFSTFKNRSNQRGDVDTQSRADSWLLGYEAIRTIESQFDALFNTEKYIPRETANQINQGSKTKDEIPAHPVVVPVPSLVDFGEVWNGPQSSTRNSSLARKWRETPFSFLIAGSTGRGELMPYKEKVSLFNIWSEQVKPMYLYIGASSHEEAARLKTNLDIEPNRILVLPNGKTNLLEEYAEQARKFPGFLAYVKLQMWKNLENISKLLNSDVISGIKLVTTDISELTVARDLLPSVKLLHGTGRNILSSLMLGADGVVATNLNRMPPVNVQSFSQLQALECQGREERDKARRALVQAWGFAISEQGTNDD